MKTLILLAAGVMAMSPAYAAGIRDTPNLVGFTVWEVTNTTFTYTFPGQGGVLDSKLTISGIASTPDFVTTAFERFDLYYSDAAGNFDLNGNYLTIDCNYQQGGGGCNIAAVRMDLSNGYLFADTLTRFVSASGYVSGSELLAADGPNTTTFAQLGTTFSSATNMSLTLGFTDEPTFTGQSSVPEPSTYAFIGAGLLGGALLRRRRR